MSCRPLMSFVAPEKSVSFDNATFVGAPGGVMSIATPVSIARACNVSTVSLVCLCMAPSLKGSKFRDLTISIRVTLSKKMARCCCWGRSNTPTRDERHKKSRATRRDRTAQPATGITTTKTIEASHGTSISAPSREQTVQNVRRARTFFADG